MKVGILGDGKWAQALARLVMAANNEPLVAYKDVKPPHVIPSTRDQQRVSKECELIIAAVSASELRNALALAKPGPQNRVVVAGRGLEPNTGRWLCDVVTEESEAMRVGALAGPAPVEEILNGGLCAGVVASRYTEVCALTQKALHSARYRVYLSQDLQGIQLAGALSPVLATLLGMSTSLRGAGVGIHAMVLSRGIAEASRLTAAVGADPNTFMGLAGVGDLVASQARPGQPAFEAGVALGRGERDKGPLPIARSLLTLAKRHKVEMPLTEALVAIYEGHDPLDAVQRLMSRDATTETASATTKKH